MSKLTIGSGNLRTTNLGIATRPAWTRPTDWTTFPTVTSAEQKFVGLYAVWPGMDNFISMTVAGAYTVDWGNGTVEDVATGVAAYHNYDYNDPDITAVSSRGYKMVLVTVTPQAGQNITSFNINTKHNQTALIATYTSGWLDIVLSFPNLTSLTLSGTANAVPRMLEKVNLVNTGLLSSLSSLFRNCISLESVTFNDTRNITNMSNLFYDCRKLQSVPLANTANVTDMGAMFYSCQSLQTTPLFNTSKVTSMANMFDGCRAHV